MRRRAASVLGKLASVTLPLAVIRAYWLLVPMALRTRMSSEPGTSVPAYDAVKYLDGGWQAFWYYALPRRHGLDGGWVNFSSTSGHIATWNFETGAVSDFYW
jgi:hypothetical protein